MTTLPAQYYIMVCEGEYPIMPIAKMKKKARGLWRSGEPLTTPVEEPLIYILDKDYPGDPKEMYYEEAAPVMSDRLAEVLKKAGVENIAYYKAILENPITGQSLENYKAYNILGLVSAADFKNSELMGIPGSTMGDINFHALAVDEEKARASHLLMFRLAENLSAVVVHEKVKIAIEQAGLPGFVFYRSGEWSG